MSTQLALAKCDSRGPERPPWAGLAVSDPGFESESATAAVLVGRPRAASLGEAAALALPLAADPGHCGTAVLTPSARRPGVHSALQVSSTAAGALSWHSLSV